MICKIGSPLHPHPVDRATGHQGAWLLALTRPPELSSSWRLISPLFEESPPGTGDFKVGSTPTF